MEIKYGGGKDLKDIKKISDYWFVEPLCPWCGTDKGRKIETRDKNKDYYFCDNCFAVFWTEVLYRSVRVEGPYIDRENLTEAQKEKLGR